MYQLPASSKFHLRNGQSENKRFECYQVKLTDAGWLALKNAAVLRFSDQPSLLKLVCNQSSGTLLIPHSQDISPLSFKFKISEFSTDTSGSLECINYPSLSRKQASQDPSKTPILRSLGKITKKLQIIANDDVFSATKKKISDAERVREQHSTQKINRHALQSASLTRVLKNQIKNKPNSDFREPSIYDRVIHLLAAHSYSINDLLQILNSEFLTIGNQKKAVMRAEKSTLQLILDKVAKLRGDKYVLLPEIYMQVHPEDWPLYGNNKELIQRVELRKAEMSNRTQSNNKKIVAEKVKQPPESTVTDDCASVRFNSVRSGPIAPHSFQKKIEALDLLADGQSITSVSLRLKIPTDTLTKWHSDEAHIRAQAKQRSIVGRHNPPEATSNAHSVNKVTNNQMNSTMSDGGKNITQNESDDKTKPAETLNLNSKTIKINNINKTPTFSNATNKKCELFKPESVDTVKVFKSENTGIVGNSNGNGSKHINDASKASSKSTVSKILSDVQNDEPISKNINQPKSQFSVNQTNKSNFVPSSKVQLDQSGLTSELNEHSSDVNENKNNLENNIIQNSLPSVHNNEQIKRKFSEIDRKSLDNTMFSSTDSKQIKLSNSKSNFEESFPPITNTEQHRAYFDIFNQEYPTYKNLFAFVEQKNNKLNQLQQILQKSNTVDQNLVNQVKELYDEIMLPETQDVIVKVCSLHSKLDLIKQRIQIYVETIGQKPIVIPQSSLCTQ